LEIAAFQHRRGDAVVIHMNFLNCSTAPPSARIRPRSRNREHVHLFLLDQADRLVDRDIGLALRIGVNRLDLVAFDAPRSLNQSIMILARDTELEPPPANGRSGRRHADLDRLAGFRGQQAVRCDQQGRGQRPQRCARNLPRIIVNSLMDGVARLLCRVTLSQIYPGSAIPGKLRE